MIDLGLIRQTVQQLNISNNNVLCNKKSFFLFKALINKYFNASAWSFSICDSHKETVPVVEPIFGWCCSAVCRFFFVGSLRDREVAFSASDLQGLNFEFCVWRAVSSHSSHNPQEVSPTQFSLYVHKSGLKPDSFNFSFLPLAFMHLTIFAHNYNLWMRRGVLINSSDSKISHHFPFCHSALTVS